MSITPFDMTLRLPQLRFDYTVEEISNVTKSALKLLDQTYSELEAVPLTDVTFSNIVEVFSRASARVETQLSHVFFLQHVSGDETIREASQTAEGTYLQFTNKTFMRLQLYLRFKQIDQSLLDNVQLKLLKDYLLQFKHTGIDLSDADRQELSQLITEMDNLCLKFSSNISDDQTHLILKTEELKGLEPDFLTRTSTEPGMHKITCKVPDVNPILEYCSVATTRESVANMRANSCAPNLEVLERLHNLRLQIANKLGYSSHVEIQLSDQMMSESPAVGDLLQSLLAELEAPTRDYIAILTKMKNADFKKDSKLKSKYKRPRCALGIADYAYYHTRYLKEHCQVDRQAIKEYFPAECVIKAMLDFYAQMFGLDFIAYRPSESDHSRKSVNSISWDNLKQHCPVAKPWHSDVLTYLVQDKSGHPMGYFYMDLYPRDGKYTHYAMWDLVGGYQDLNDIQDLNVIQDIDDHHDRFQVLPVASLVGNFPEPMGDKPSLLDISEVETLFHEFGHVLHGICGGARNKYIEFAGTNTETDFVEAPSQMKEQWVYEPAVLKMISSHYKTGHSLPDDLIQSVVTSRHIGVSYDWSKIIAMALVDWEIHRSETKYSHQFMANLLETTLTKYSQHVYASGRYIAAWGHIGYQNYAGRYYSYVWTMVLACDLYSRFAENPINPVIGMEYRQKILSPGGTKPGAEMIRDFLGRDPTVHAFLKNFVGL